MTVETPPLSASRAISAGVALRCLSASRSPSIVTDRPTLPRCRKQSATVFGARQINGGALDVFDQEKQAGVMERVSSFGDSWSEAELACTTGGLRRATQASSTMKSLMFK